MIRYANQPIDDITNTTSLSQQVGLCYYDPIDETLKEFNTIPSHLMSVNPYETVLRKYYLVAQTNVSAVSIRLTDSSNLNIYSAKVIISDIEPTIALFNTLGSFNNYVISNPTAYTLIPVWILLNSTSAISTICSLEIEIEYE